MFVAKLISVHGDTIIFQGNIATYTIDIEQQLQNNFTEHAHIMFVCEKETWLHGVHSMDTNSLYAIVQYCTFPLNDRYRAYLHGIYTRFSCRSRITTNF